MCLNIRFPRLPLELSERLSVKSRLRGYYPVKWAKGVRAWLFSLSSAAVSLDCHGAVHIEEDFSWRLLSVNINGNTRPMVARLLKSPQYGLLVTGEDLRRWELHVPEDSKVLMLNEMAYYSLDRFEGLQYSIDSARQALVLRASPQLLVGASVDLAMEEFTTPQSSNLGGFLNYDLLHQMRSDAVDTTSGTLELAGFNHWGLMSTTFLARDSEVGYGASRVVRLNSQLRHDVPGSLRTLTLGDSYSRAGAWGRSVLYGGVQWGTNFSTQPDFTTFPMPSIEGEATVPSSIEIYANDRRQTESTVNAGPFTVRNIPVVTGANDVRLIVTDALGREQVVVSSFYTSQQLLRSGLQDFTYEVGAIREDYTRKSNEYGRGFMVANHALGLSDTFTGGARLEALASQQTAGLSGAWLAHPRFGVVTGSLAGSTADTGEGGLASLGVEHRGRYLSFGASTTATTAGFRQLGLPDDTSAPSLTHRATIAGSLPAGSAFGMGYAEIRRRDDDDSRIVSANLSTRLTSRSSLSLYASRELVSDESFIGASFSMSLGERASVSFMHDVEETGYHNRLQLQRSAPRGNGVGYRVSAEQFENESHDGRAEVSLRTDHASYLMEAALEDSKTDYRLNATGGIAMLEGNVFATRRIDDGFSMVKVGTYPGVTIYSENQPVATTNASGVALIPDLRSFEKNRLSFEQSDVSLGARLERLDSTITPGYRRGVMVNFDVVAADGALLTVHQKNGEPIPAGAVIRSADGAQRFPVARRGEAWVTGLKAITELSAQWDATTCYFTVQLPDNSGPMPRVGPLICQELP